MEAKKKGSNTNLFLDQPMAGLKKKALNFKKMVLANLRKPCQASPPSMNYNVAMEIVTCTR
jgi:hypothetical protein